jgi:imidazolonepropionase-like amidohydrolase
MLRDAITAVLLGISLAAQGPPAADALALVNATVLNVGDGSLQRGATIVVRAGRIESVGTAAAPAGVRAIDLRDKFVVPGLIDAHVHIENLITLQAALHSGVTTVRSSGVPHYADVGMRELVKAGALTGPDVLPSGYHVRSNLGDIAGFLTRSQPVLTASTGDGNG